MQGCKEVLMNRIERKEIVSDAANIFKEEVLASSPDISRRELCDMVDDYIYYQTDDISRNEAVAVVDTTCRNTVAGSTAR
jgi:hypothetical protein